MSNPITKRIAVINYDFDLTALSLICKCDVISRTYSSEENFSDDIYQAYILVVGRTINISSSTIKKLKNCLAIIRPGIGSDNIDSREAEKCNIKVLTTLGYCVDEVADHTIALMLSYSRRIIKASNKFNAGGFDRWNPILYSNMKRLRDKSLGIVGMGCIGQAVARRAASFNMKIYYYDPYLNPGMRKVINSEPADSLIELFNSSDYVSVHAPLTPETVNMIKISDISQIKDSIVMINTSRGKIISNKTILHGLKSGKIEAFLTDVLESEPPDRADDLMMAFANNEDLLHERLIVTPHIAYLSQESTDEVVFQTTKLVKSVLSSG